MKLSVTKLRLFDIAKSIAILSTYRMRHGAILVKHGRVVASSFNKNRSCLFASRFRDPSKGIATVHAELGAILNVPYSLTEGADIYVVRVNKRGDLMNSKPCEMCCNAATFVGVKRIFYSLGLEDFDAVKLA